MRINNLCAAHWSSYIVDVLVVALFVVIMIMHGKKGFINCFFGIISTAAAFLAAVLFAKLLLVCTGGLFGLEDAMSNRFADTFSKIKGFGSDISDVGVEVALKEQDVSVIISRLIMKLVGANTQVPAGTTLGMLAGRAVATLTATLICGIILFIATKLLMLLLKKVLNKVAEKIKIVGAVNVLLGCLVGFLFALLITSAALSLLTIIPSVGLAKYLSESVIVSALYKYNPVIVILGWFL